VRPAELTPEERAHALPDASDLGPADENLLASAACVEFALLHGRLLDLDLRPADLSAAEVDVDRPARPDLVTVAGAIDPAGSTDVLMFEGTARWLELARARGYSIFAGVQANNDVVNLLVAHDADGRIAFIGNFEYELATRPFVGFLRSGVVHGRPIDVLRGVVAGGAERDAYASWARRDEHS
jgi:hypothetical protein